LVDLREYILKFLLPEAFFNQHAPNSVWRPDSLAELTALPLIVIKWSLLLREGDGKGIEGGEKRREGEGGRWERKGVEGRGRIREE